MIFAGFLIDGRQGMSVTGFYGAMNADTPDEGRAAVRAAKQRGFDFIKVYSSLPDSAFLAIADEAQRLGLPVAGHGVHSVGLERGMAAGQRLIAHAEEYFYAFYGPKPQLSEIPRAVAVTKRYPRRSYRTSPPTGSSPGSGGVRRPSIRCWLLRLPPTRSVLAATLARERLHHARRLARRPVAISRTSDQSHERFANTTSRRHRLTGDSRHGTGLLGARRADPACEAGLTPYQALVAGTRAAGEYVQHEMPTAEHFGTISRRHAGRTVAGRAQSTGERGACHAAGRRHGARPMAVARGTR